jgi:hypothetical protein
MELMLATARMNVPTNTAYLSRRSFGLSVFDVMRSPSRAVEMRETRHDQYCNQEIEYARNGGRPGDLIVLLSDRPRGEEMAAGITCAPLSWARYCERPKE